MTVKPPVAADVGRQVIDNEVKKRSTNRNPLELLMAKKPKKHSVVPDIIGHSIAPDKRSGRPAKVPPNLAAAFDDIENHTAA